ncbi:MAG: host-nuclease inhibitor Gam family protein [Candidatus Andersenbacteria bacterium]
MSGTDWWMLYFVTRNRSMPKAKTSRTTAIRSLKDAARVVGKIGQLKRNLERVTVQMNEKIEKIKQPYTEKAGGYIAELEPLMEAMFRYAQGNRPQLTDNGERQTVKLPTGSFYWRKTGKSVQFTGSDDELVDLLKALGLSDWVRVVEEPNRERMLQEEEKAQAVAGVTIEQREVFYVKPAASMAAVTVTPEGDHLKIVPKDPRKQKDKKSA